MRNRPEHIQGLILATLGSLALTPDGLLVRLVDAHDWTIVFWRGAVVAFGLFILQLFKHKSRGLLEFYPRTRIEVFSACLSAMGTTTFVLSITHTTVANALVILSTMSFFAALMSLIFLKERVARRTWVAMFFAFVGIVIVFMDDLGKIGISGELFALGCAFVTAANMTLIRSHKTINVPVCFAWGGIILVIICFFMAPTLRVDTQSSMALVVMGCLSAAAFVLLGLGAKRIPAPEVTLLMLLETIIGPVWVWWILHETPSLNTMIGGTVVVATLMVHALVSLRVQKK